MKNKRAELDPFVVQGEFHSQLHNGQVRCEVCPR
jgi:hypothetical protein